MRYHTHSPWPLTYMVKKILIINAAIWVLSALLVNWGGYSGLFYEFALTPSHIFSKFKLWQLFTYMWLHDPTGLWHILLNSLFLWMFGGSMEIMWGQKAFLKFYILCGLGAGFIVFLVGGLFSPDIPTVGASGAVDGVLIAWAVTNWNRQFMFFGIFPMKGKHFAGVNIGFILISLILKDTGSSHAAHLGGMITGALLITGYWRPTKALRKLRYYMLRRKIKIVEEHNREKNPDGGYWN